MDYTTKVKLLQNFLNQWNHPFQQIPHALIYLSSYPEVTEQLVDFEVLDKSELEASQLEWVALLAQLEHPIDTSFFKDYWVPIQKDGYYFFIDLSSDALPLFEAKYFFFEPYRWYKKFLIHDLSQFLLKLDHPKFDMQAHLSQLHDENLDTLLQIQAEQNTLGFAGKLKPLPVTQSSIFCENQGSEISYKDGGLTITGIHSIIVALLPHDCAISLDAFGAIYNEDDEVGEKVKSIAVLVYLLQSVGIKSIDYFSITFEPEGRGSATYHNNEFTIIHKDSSILTAFIENYERFKGA